MLSAAQLFAIGRKNRWSEAGSAAAGDAGALGRLGQLSSGSGPGRERRDPRVFVPEFQQNAVKEGIYRNLRSPVRFFLN